MMQFNKIWAHSRYEVTTLLRGWFFRIAASATLIILLIMSIVLFTPATPLPRIFKGFTSAIPYANMILLSIAQMVILIFISGDFYKRDNKLNTAEVFFIRSISNAGYLTGKAIGVFILYLAMILITLLFSAIIHGIFSESTFSYEPYLIYPFVISTPSFVFILGLSFFLMRLIRNQAVVVLVLLGYFAATMFFLSYESNYIFDFLAWRLPLAYSDFVGMVNLDRILLQRGIYLFAGVMFFILAILTFHRLPQERRLNVLLTGVLFIAAICSLACIYLYHNTHAQDRALRERMRQLNQKYVGDPHITALSNDIFVQHDGEQINATSHLTYQNKHQESIPYLVFSLNPGLVITQVQKDNQQLSFQQTDHICRIELPESIKSQQIDSIEISYFGSINEAACYIDISEEKRQEPFYIWLYQVEKKHAFITNNYVMLPPEALWYPNPGLPAGAGFPDKISASFIDFSLRVSADENLTVIAQGDSSITAGNETLFEPEYPLPAISLLIGPYKKEAVTVDSVDFSLYRLPHHDYYQESLTEVGDTLEYIIRDVFRDFEIRLDLDYPFNRLSLVEVPINYYVYPRLWSVVQDAVQPEQVWIQEDAAALFHADFNLSSRIMERRLDRSNQTLTEIESQTTLLTNFFNYTFLGKKPRRFFFRGFPVSYWPDYNIFANFFTYSFNIRDNTWQIFNNALEAYLDNRVRSATQNTPPWLIEGLSDEETANIMLRDSSLAQLLKESPSKNKLPGLLKQKGAYLIKLIKDASGSEMFSARLKRAIEKFRHTDVSLAQFLNHFDTMDHNDFYAHLETWYNGKQIPSFYIFGADLYKVLDKDRIRTQAIFSITNLSDIDGLIEVSFRYSRRGRGMRFGSSDDEDPPLLYQIPAGRSKQIGILLDEEPRSIAINLLIANNLPLVYSKRFEEAELKENIEAFHGENYMDSAPVLVARDEIIIDNEDNAVTLFNPPHTSILKQMIHGDRTVSDKKNYDRFQWWDPPPKWTLIKNAVFYGTYLHSAFYIRSGNGERYVTWQAQIQESGIYDIYTYMFDRDNFWRGRRRSSSMFGDFEYLIRHDSGEETVLASPDDAPEGWFYLGSWFLSAGTAEVVLSNKSDGSIVIADAIKWVKN